MFVRFECGCVGCILGGKTILITSCTADWSDDPIGFHESDRCEDKASKPLPPEEAAELITDIGKLIRDGYKLRALKQLLS